MLRLLAISAAIVLLGGCEKSSSRHRQIAAGSLSTCRLVEGGKVTCWGEGSVVAAQGSSTSGARTITSPNAVVDVNDATQIAVGLSSACAVRRNATAVCWGIDWSTATPGQNESLRRPAMVARLSDVAEVSKVSCWGTTEPTDAREQDRTGKPSAPRKVEL